MTSRVWATLSSLKDRIRGLWLISMATAPAPCVGSPGVPIPYLAMSLAMTKTLLCGNFSTWSLA